MARKNTFKLETFTDEIIRDLEKSEKKQLAKASNYFNKELRGTIRSKGLVDEGNLLKGVKKDNYRHTVLVGVGAPGFHANIVEYGTAERFGKDGRSFGVMPATPFFLPTFRLATPGVQKILSEEWL